jgi:hypothetical protein
MIRLVLTELALFSVPWLMWWGIHGRKMGWDAAVEEAPRRRLTLLGLGLAAFGLTAFMQQPDQGVRGHYVPAHVENGVFVPERFEKAPTP